MLIRRLLFAPVILTGFLHAQFVEPPEPPALEPAYAHVPLPASGETVLCYRATKDAGLRAVVAAPVAPIIVGQWKHAASGTGLAGLEAALEMDETATTASSLEFPNTARALGN